VPPEIGQKMVDKKGSRSYLKGKKRDLHEADINHLKKAAEAYLYVAKKYKWIVINCTKRGEIMSREAIHEVILKKLRLL
jgi:dTMP kinase